ncbi:outer membrane protein, adhesin transport system [Burkholderia sp. GAS332]|nr:outer membrane protein, adhesin transport system [Burkholderia sp. GAS332]
MTAPAHCFTVSRPTPPPSRKRAIAWLAASLLTLTAPLAIAANADSIPQKTVAEVAGRTGDRSVTTTVSSSGKVDASGSAAGPAARWLESQPDTFGAGPTLSEAELRRIFFEAVSAAADRSPRIQQAQASYQATIADVDQAKGERWPQVQIGAQTSSLQYGANAGGSANPGNAVSLNVTTSVYDWGRINKTIASRQQTAEAAQQAYRAEIEASGYEVAATLVELGKQRLLMDLSQQLVERMQQLVSMLGEIVAVDRGRSSELTQAKSRLLEAQAQRDGAQTQVRNAELQLQKLVGENAVMIPRTRVWSLQPGTLSRLLDEVEQHPAIAQAQAAATAAEFSAAAVKASSLPAVNWVVTANTGRGKQSGQTMLTMSWNAFQGGSAKAASKAALARAEASRREVEQQRRDLAFGVQAADQDAHALLSRADLYAKLSTETDIVRKAFFEQWYHLGKRTLLDVLSAENEHHGNRVSEVTTRFEGYQAVFREYAQAGMLVRWLEGDR